MAQNITRLAELAYPKEKMIVWAHNGHIDGTRPDARNNPSMDGLLRARWGDQLMTIGIFMLRGVTANNENPPIGTVGPPRPGSLEAYAYSLRLAAVYLPIPRIDAPGTGDDWLHRPIPFYVWGTLQNTDTMAGSYDGLIIIDQSTLPPYN